MNREARFTLAMELLGGDAEAALFVVQAGDLARLADNLADNAGGDRHEAMARLLILAVQEIPTNPFFRANADLLRHALAQVAACWQVSNRFHGAEDEKRHTFGFVMREAIDILVMQVAGICVGWQAAASVYERLFAAAHGNEAETVSDWAKERL